MWSFIYKKLVIDFSKITLLVVLGVVIFSLYQAKNFNLDISDLKLMEQTHSSKVIIINKKNRNKKKFIVKKKL